MEKKRYTADQLHDFVEVVSEIHCSSCDKSDTECSDDYSASEDFFKDGWRATRAGNVYCPDCAAKKLVNP